MRVRLRRDCRDPARMQALKADLSSRDGITGVETNPVSGSVLIQYDARKHRIEDACNILHEANVMADAGLNKVEEPASEYSEVATMLLKVVDAVDTWLSKVTGRKVDVRVLVPLGLAATGIAVAVVRESFGFADIPAFVILWVAVDAFIQLHRSDNNDAKPEPESSPALAAA
jgi:hypothetical protein